ncbi:Calx-beta domain-containing protein [Actinoplanes sp. M2I2]|uniref:beta strand repeat-containing protein n=1 Tax=Actinoplanes sp. M2I2 TaxID=1734444 RepID=UPI002021DD4E|nr:Calx-beta domain-containing protein [Actinoplanes sp. M2I2]
MRYPEAHAAKSGSVPFMLRGPKSVRTALATVTAGVVGLVPVIAVASPAFAAPVAAVYTITAAQAVEGNAVVFTITRPAPAAGSSLLEETLTYTPTTEAGQTATATTDYTATPGTVTFPEYSTTTAPQSRTISIPTVQDTIDEPDQETFTVTLTNPTPAAQAGTFSAGGAVAVGTILDDDNPTYTLSASPNPVSENLVDANRHATITALLSKQSPYTVTIPVATANGTATSGQDYDAINTSISIPPNTSSGSTQVEITNDNIDEADIQSFTVNGSAGANVAGTASTTVNIADNDAAPVVSIASAGRVTEGSPSLFNVTMSGRSEQVVTARWDTSDLATATDPTHGIAKAGLDYTAVTNGSVSIPALATAPTSPISVATLPDSLDEVSPEDFKVTLSGVANGTLGATSSAEGGIDDSGSALGPQVTLTPTTVTEGGPNATKARTFTVKLSKSSGREQRVGYAVAAGTGAGTIGVATAGDDFTATTGTLTFAPGDTEKTFTVDIIGDDVDEDDGENIAVTLTDASVSGTQLSAGLNLGVNQVTITDDDDKPSISLAQASMTMPEGNGYSAALFQVNLSNPSKNQISWKVNYATPAGTAEAALAGLGSDDFDPLTTLNTTQNIAPGATSGYVLLLVKGDTVFETDETVRLEITRDAGETDATGGPLTGVLTLKNDDAAPILVVDSRNAVEGDVVALTGVTSGAAQDATLLNVTATGKANHGTIAAATGDFSPTSFPVNVPAGTPSGTTVPIGNLTITDDNYAEPAEAVEISGVGFGGTGSVRDGWVTIAASDGGTTPGEPGEEPGEAPTPTINAPMAVNGTGPVSITGKVAANASVELWGAPVSGGDLKWIATTKAAANGNYSFSRSIVQGTRFVTQSQEVNSAEATVWVNQWASLTASSPSKGRVSVTVKTIPNAAGRKVVVQRWTGPNTWTNLLVSKANVNGAYAATAAVPSGTVALRAWVDGDEDRGINGGWSAIVRPVIK